MPRAEILLQVCRQIVEISTVIEFLSEEINHIISPLKNALNPSE